MLHKKEQLIRGHNKLDVGSNKLGSNASCAIMHSFVSLHFKSCDENKNYAVLLYEDIN